MSVLCTVICDIKPECTNDFVDALAGMFPVTKTHAGFINIRLLKSDANENEFILVQEWETTEHHHAYVSFRGEQGDLDRLAAFTASPMLIHYWDTSPLASA